MNDRLAQRRLCDWTMTGSQIIVLERAHRPRAKDCTPMRRLRARRRLSPSSRPRPSPPSPSRPPPSASTWRRSTAAVKPGDGFEQYANGAWRAATKIPADRTNIGAFVRAAEIAEQRNDEIIAGRRRQSRARNAAAQDRRLLCGLSWTRPRSSGAGSLRCSPTRGDRRDRRQARALARALGASCAPTSIRSTRPISTPKICSACSSPRGCNDPTATSPYLLQGGLGMPDREYYLSATRHGPAPRRLSRLYRRRC